MEIYNEMSGIRRFEDVNRDKYALYWTPGFRVLFTPYTLLLSAHSEQSECPVHCGARARDCPFSWQNAYASCFFVSVVDFTMLNDRHYVQGSGRGVSGIS